jgi:hypothetical protein
MRAPIKWIALLRNGELYWRLMTILLAFAIVLLALKPVLSPFSH